MEKCGINKLSLLGNAGSFRDALGLYVNMSDEIHLAMAAIGKPGLPLLYSHRIPLNWFAQSFLKIMFVFSRIQQELYNLESSAQAAAAMVVPINPVATNLVL